MKIISLLLIISIYSFCTKTDYKNTKVYFSVESFTTITPVRCGDLKFTEIAKIDSIEISDLDFLKKLESEIAKLEGINDPERQLNPLLDTRYEVVITTNKGETENLCFSTFGDIVLNDSTMRESPVLVQLFKDEIEKSN